MRVTAPAAERAPGSGGLWERDEAVAAIRRAVAAGRNLLVHGPEGVGKSAALRVALSGQPRRPLFCSAPAGAELYREALTRLAACGNTVAEAGLGRAAGLSSVGYRGLVERALGEDSYCLVWDPAPMASRHVANALRILLRVHGTPLLCAARLPHMDAIGYLSIFFTLQSEKLRIPPLSEAGARRFAEAEMARLQADFSEPEQVIEQVLELAADSPGWIRGMLEMAREPRYLWEGQVKIHSVYLDLLAGRMNPGHVGGDVGHGGRG